MAGNRQQLAPVKPPSAILNMNLGFSTFSSRRPLDRGSSRGGPSRSSRSAFTSSARQTVKAHTSGQPPTRCQDYLIHKPCWLFQRLPTQGPGSWFPQIPPPLVPSGTRVSSPFHPLPLLPKSPVSPSGLSLCSCASSGFSSPLSPGIGSEAVERGRKQKERCYSLPTPDDRAPNSSPRQH